MDQLRFGRQFRALRIRQGKRQQDVADESGLSRSLIALIDRGQLSGVTVRSIIRASVALGAEVDLRLRWRGEALDRLLDEDHAAIVETVVRRLRAAGWTVEVEASFAIWGERGSIDVLGFHPATGALVVIEVKSVVPDSQAMLHGIDRKARLASDLAAERGWRVQHVGRLLVIGDTDTSRRRLARLAATYDAVLPARGPAVRQWLRRPDRPLGGVLFVSYGTQRSTRRPRRGRERVRRGKRPHSTAARAAAGRAPGDSSAGPPKAIVAVE